MVTSRLEAFSDGVIAVAITLLVLDIAVPDPRVTTHLGHALLMQWPRYAAYVTSFLTIGIIWINHHAMIGRLRSADHWVMTLNLLLLLSIAVIPFATSLVASYLKQARGEHLAAGVYASSLLIMGILFVALNRHILIRRPELMRDTLPETLRRSIMRRNFGGIMPYVLAAALAPLSAYLTLAICFIVAVYYALPRTTADAGQSSAPGS